MYKMKSFSETTERFRKGGFVERCFCDNPPNAKIGGGHFAEKLIDIQLTPTVKSFPSFLSSLTTAGFFPLLDISFDFFPSFFSFLECLAA